MRTTAFVCLLIMPVFLSGCEKASEPLPPPTAEDVAAATDAALNGGLAAITAALKNGMPVDQTDEYGNSLLMLAAFNGHDELVQALLAADADVALRNGEGRTALMFASTGLYPQKPVDRTRYSC